MARTEELKRQDKRILHESLTAVSQLKALNYHLPNEGRSRTNDRDKYRTTLRFRDSVSLIFKRYPAWRIGHHGLTDR